MTFNGFHFKIRFFRPRELILYYLFLDKMRNYKRKTTRSTVKKDVVEQAINEIAVLRIKTARQASVDYNIPYRTLLRYCKQTQEGQSISIGYKKNRQVNNYFLNENSRFFLKIFFCYSYSQMNRRHVLPNI